MLARPRRALPVIASSLAVLSVIAVPARAEDAGAGPWQVIRVSDGITVKRRVRAGVSLHEFQGRAVIEAPIARVLAVMDDPEHRPEWSGSCVTARMIERRGERVTLIYDRTAAPWPVADRDAVIEGTLTLDPATVSVRIDFRGVADPRVPEVKGVVRMPHLEGHWLLTPINGGAATDVEYQVHADPGGRLPDWLTNLASRALPEKTLKGLRKQVKHPRYDEMAQRIMARPEYKRIEAARQAEPK